MDEWSIVLMLSTVYADTLLFTSIYSFALTVISALLGPLVGALVDAKPRLTSVRFSATGQKFGIAVAACALYALWACGSELGSAGGPALFTAAVLASAVMRLSNMATTISVEKDWSMVIAAGDKASQTKLNAYLRRVDLICKLAAPLFVSLIAMYISVPRTSLVVAGWCIGTLPLELILYHQIHRLVPELSLPKTKPGADDISLDDLSVPRTPTEAASLAPAIAALALGAEDADAVWAVAATQEGTAADLPPPASAPARSGVLARTVTSWSLYIQHPILLPSVSLSCLYLSTLTFGGPMITYLLAVGYSPTLLAGMRALSVLAGLSATVTLAPLTRRVGFVRAGLWSLWSQAASLMPAALAVAGVGGQVQGGLEVAIVFFGGVTLSRWGLWSFDLVETQLIQDTVADDEIGLINGAQFSLQSVFELLSYVLTMIWSSAAQFYITSYISTGAVFIAAGIYSVYARKIRGHLIHFD
ncbi:hypothetical protein HK101_004840 [Irineochytrium annulatum]|nr:hypothetical protein HK101_004840 [Irineochytrium annulatum]